MRAGLGEGGGVSRGPRKVGPGGRGRRNRSYAISRKCAHKGPKSFELFSVQITAPCVGRCTAGASVQNCCSPMESSHWTGVFRPAEHGVRGALTECCPGLLVGPRWHYAPVHCERAHGHLDCRAPEWDPVAAETESSSALCGISRPGAMNTRAVASRLGYPEHVRSGMRPCALWGRVPANRINRMKTSVAATILHGIGRRPKRLRSVARHRRYTTRPCRSLSSGESCPTQ
jgi:hypothetical protein